MTVPPGDNSADLHAEIVALRAERDAAVARQATRDSDYTERAAHQGATVEVLRAMAGSRGDPKPVFEVIVRRTRDLCDAYSASLAQVVDGSIVLRAYVIADEAAAKQHEANFPRPLAADTMFGRAILARKPVQLPDVAADQTYGLREGTLRGSVRAQAAVPLMRDGGAIGAINITRRETGEFSPAQIELLQTFAAQAVIAINSAETDRNLREALEQQTATAELLQVINASPGNLALVFDTMLEKALRLCEAAFGVLLVRDGDHFRTAALHGVPPALAEVLADTPRRPGKHTAVGRMLDGEEFVQFEDMTKEPAYLAGDPRQQAFVELGGARTYVAVALRKDADLVGSIAAYRRDVRQFSQMQIALLRNFATQAVIAMENARLLNEMREALEQQTATADVLGVINAFPGDLAPVFQVILEMAHRLCGSTLGSLLTFDGTRFTRVASHGYPAHMAETLQVPYPPQPRHEALLRGERFVQIMDLRETGIGPNEPISREVTDTLGLRTGLYVPLRKDGRLVGLISSYRQEVRPFSDRHIALLENFAAQAVVAMENARLLNETREALERQTATSEILRVIAHSPTDVQPVFDAIVASAARVCEAEFGAVARLDQGLLHLVAVHSTSPEETAAFHQLFPRVPTRNFAMGRAFLDAEPVYFDDLLTWRDYDNRTREGLPGSRSFLAVPILRDGRPVGVVGCGRREVNPFTGTQIELLKTFADQAAIAIENVRLFNELETRNRELIAALDQQTATAEVLQVINSSPGDLAPVFDAILEKAHGLCDIAHGSLQLYDGESLRAVATHGVSASFADVLRQGYRAADSPASRRLIEGGRFVQIADCADIDHPVFRSAAELAGIRTVLFVPLRRDDTLLGLISSARREVRLFTDKQIALLENFAAHAVIAMENARLLTEQREALEQQTATAEVLQVINANPGNLTPVFDAILEKAARLCEAEMGTLWTYDGEYMQPAAMRGAPPSYAEFLKKGPHRPNWAQSRVLRGERIIHTVDVKGEGYRSGDPLTLAGADLGAIRTLLVVPLRKDEAALGTIGIYRQEVRPFTDKQIALLENFAAQAVIAMENARLINEQREALEQQTATAEVLQVINANPGNLTPVFDAMLDKAIRLCDATYGHFRTYDGEGFPLGAAAVSGDPNLVELHRAFPYFVPGPHNPISRFRRGESLIHISDAAASEAYRDDPRWRELVDTGACRSLLAVALRKDTALLGYISVYRQEVRPFSEKEIALLENFAAQAVIAMENARLLDEIRQRQEELRVTFENMGDGVAMFDADLRLAAWNRNFQEIIDLPDALLAERPGYADYMRVLAERGEFGATGIEAELRQRIEDTDEELRLERVRPDGRVIEVRRNAVPGGGFVLIYADITERKRNEAALRAARDAAEAASRTIEAAYRDLKAAQANLIQAEKMASLGQLTAGIAHEIKNPLNFVNNFAALSVDLLAELKETAAPGFAALSEQQRAEIDDVSAMLTSNLEKITEHGNRADRIVKAMLEHSRGSSGERRTVDLNALIDEALNLAYHGARAQDQSFNITLERDLAAGIAPIEVNPQDMTRVFLNIFSNGFYATTKRARDGADAGFLPTLKVTTRSAGDAVEIRVRDNGIGIPADIRDKLFQPFFTTKPTGEGTGLGLSITYDIVTQQHGGSIAVDSKVGEYSEFTIRLPRDPTA